MPTACRAPTNLRKALGAVAGIDAHVFGGEVAGPIAGHGWAGVEIHDDGNVLGQQTIAGSALVEIERLAAAEDCQARHLNVHFGWMEVHAGTPPAAAKMRPQLGSAPANAVFTKGEVAIVAAMRRAASSEVAPRTSIPDYALRALLAVGHDLQGERAADVFEGFPKGAVRVSMRFDGGRSGLARWRCTSRVSFVEVSPSTLMALKVRAATSCSVFCKSAGAMLASVATKASMVAMLGCESCSAHLGAADQMDALAGHLEGGVGGFGASVRGADGERELRERARGGALVARDDRQRAQNFIERERNTDYAGGADEEFLRLAIQTLGSFVHGAERGGVAGSASGTIGVASVDDYCAHAAFGGFEMLARDYYWRSDH